MKDIVGLVDYGKAGNCHSVEKALVRAGANVQIVRNAADLAKVDKIVLPGVGSFVDGVAELKEKGLFEHLQRDIPNKPTLGICLGMQMFSKQGEELGYISRGFDFLNVTTQRLDTSRLIPHVGFRTLSLRSHVRSPLFVGLEDQEFYFMHSNALQDSESTIATALYGDLSIVAAVNINNIYGVQFHPEKSRDVGIQLFKNFLSI